MLQNSLFFPSAETTAEFTTHQPEALPTAETRRRKKRSSIEEVSKPQVNSRKDQIVADAQTPILDRYAPNEVVPLTELLEVYQEVDRRLAELLEKSTTAAEVACAFTAEPYACYGEAVHLIGEGDLLKRVAADLRSLDPVTALYQLAQLPPFFQEKVWAQFSLQEQQQFAQASRQMQGGQP